MFLNAHENGQEPWAPRNAFGRIGENVHALKAKKAPFILRVMNLKKEVRKG